MILAAPLVIPFAKAVGLSVGTLGMAALADQVNDYIQANPEESMKILSTIIPNVGIGQIFMSKEDKISLEDLDEMTDEEAQDLSKEEKAELMKQAGKSGGPNKRQTMIDISEKLGLSGSGKEKQDIEYEIDERYDEGGVEEVSKPKFDYKKFFRNRRADGGAIGIEVLFREKKNLGGLLTGQAKSIYDSMMAAGYFTEDEIKNAIINAGYEIPGETPTQDTGIISTAPNIINQGGGGDGPPGPTPTGTKTYGKTFTGMTMPDGTPIGSSGIVAGPGIIDSLKNAATDLYGLYQKFSPIGIFSNFMKQRAEKQETLQNNAIEKARKEREMQEAIAEAERKEKERAAQYGATNYGKGVGGQSYSGDAIGAPGLGFGVGATTGGPVSNKTGRGRQDYSKGGLATMSTRRR